MRNLLLLGVVIIASVMPGGVSASTSGQLVASGVVTLPAGKFTTSDQSGLYVNDSRMLTGLRLEAAKVTLVMGSLELAEAGNPGVGIVQVPTKQSQAWSNFTNVTLTEDAPAPGWLGAYAGGTLYRNASTSTGVDPAASQIVGNAPLQPQPSPTPDLPVFSVGMQDGISLTGGGTYHVAGSFAFKFEGLNATLVSQQDTVRIGTGSTRVGAAGTYSRNETWAFLVVEDGSLSFVSSAPTISLTHAASASLDGVVSFDSGKTQASIDGVAYSGTSTIGMLDGKLDGTIKATQGESVFSFSGLVRSTNLQAQSTFVKSTTPSGMPTFGWVLIVVGMASAGTAGATLILRRRIAKSPRSVEFDVDRYVQLALLAADEEKYATALDWTRQALVLVPNSARLRTDEGFYLSALGDVDGALEAYGLASTLSDDGEADFLAASLLASTASPVPMVIDALSVALARTPRLRLEVAGESAFDQYRQGVAFMRLMDEASARDVPS